MLAQSEGFRSLVLSLSKKGTEGMKVFYDVQGPGNTCFRIRQIKVDTDPVFSSHVVNSQCFLSQSLFLYLSLTCVLFHYNNNIIILNRGC